VTNGSSDNVSVISTATNTVVATVPIVNGSYSSGPYAVAITPNGAFAYVANAAAGTVSVIDTSTNTVIAAVSVGTVPHGVAITPDGAFAYVGNEYSSTVSVINTATNTVVDTVTGVAVAPEGVAITLRNNAVRCR
jgi:YVTN family beta-propeller protein